MLDLKTLFMTLAITSSFVAVALFLHGAMSSRRRSTARGCGLCVRNKEREKTMIKRIVTSLLATAILLLQIQICSAGEIPAAFRADINKLLKMTGSEDLGLQMAMAMSNQIIDAMSKEDPGLSPRVIEMVKEEINRVYVEEMPSLMAEIVPIYAKHFTHDEVKSLIAFYETPVGRKSTQVMPAILNECMKAGEAWGEGLAPKLLPRLESRIKEEGL